MPKYRPLPQSVFSAAVAAFKDDRADYEPSELEEARRRNDAFFAARQRERSGLHSYERDISLLREPIVYDI